MDFTDAADLSMLYPSLLCRGSGNGDSEWGSLNRARFDSSSSCQSQEGTRPDFQRIYSSCSRPNFLCSGPQNSVGSSRFLQQQARAPLSGDRFSGPDASDRDRGGCSERYWREEEVSTNYNMGYPVNDFRCQSAPLGRARHTAFNASPSKTLQLPSPCCANQREHHTSPQDCWSARNCEVSEHRAPLPFTHTRQGSDSRRRYFDNTSESRQCQRSTRLKENVSRGVGRFAVVGNQGVDKLTVAPIAGAGAQQGGAAPISRVAGLPELASPTKVEGRGGCSPCSMALQRLMRDSPRRSFDISDPTDDSIDSLLFRMDDEEDDLPSARGGRSDETTRCLDKMVEPLFNLEDFVMKQLAEVMPFNILSSKSPLEGHAVPRGETPAESEEVFMKSPKATKPELPVKENCTVGPPAVGDGVSEDGSYDQSYIDSMYPACADMDITPDRPEGEEIQNIHNSNNSFTSDSLPTSDRRHRQGSDGRNREMAYAGVDDGSAGGGGHDEVDDDDFPPMRSSYFDRPALATTTATESFIGSSSLSSSCSSFEKESASNLWEARAGETTVASRRGAGGVARHRNGVRRQERRKQMGWGSGEVGGDLIRSKGNAGPHERADVSFDSSSDGSCPVLKEGELNLRDNINHNNNIITNNRRQIMARDVSRQSDNKVKLSNCEHRGLSEVGRGEDNAATGIPSSPSSSLERLQSPELRLGAQDGKLEREGGEGAPLSIPVSKSMGSLESLAMNIPVDADTLGEDIDLYAKGSRLRIAEGRGEGERTGHTRGAGRYGFIQTSEPPPQTSRYPAGGRWSALARRSNASSVAAIRGTDHQGVVVSRHPRSRAIVSQSSSESLSSSQSALGRGIGSQERSTQDMQNEFQQGEARQDDGRIIGSLAEQGGLEAVDIGREGLSFEVTQETVRHVYAVESDCNLSSCSSTSSSPAMARRGHADKDVSSGDGSMQAADGPCVPTTAYLDDGKVRDRDRSIRSLQLLKSQSRQRGGPSKHYHPLSNAAGNSGIPNLSAEESDAGADTQQKAKVPKATAKLPSLDFGDFDDDAGRQSDSSLDEFGSPLLSSDNCSEQRNALKPTPPVSQTQSSAGLQQRRVTQIGSKRPSTTEGKLTLLPSVVAGAAMVLDMKATPRLHSASWTARAYSSALLSSTLMEEIPRGALVKRGASRLSPRPNQQRLQTPPPGLGGPKGHASLAQPPPPALKEGIVPPLSLRRFNLLPADFPRPSARLGAQNGKLDWRRSAETIPEEPNGEVGGAAATRTDSDDQRQNDDALGLAGTSKRAGADSQEECMRKSKGGRSGKSREPSGDDFDLSSDSELFAQGEDGGAGNDAKEIAALSLLSAPQPPPNAASRISEAFSECSKAKCKCSGFCKCAVVELSDPLRTVWGHDRSQRTGDGQQPTMPPGQREQIDTVTGAKGLQYYAEAAKDKSCDGLMRAKGAPSASGFHSTSSGVGVLSRLGRRRGGAQESQISIKDRWQSASATNICPKVVREAILRERAGADSVIQRPITTGRFGGLHRGVLRSSLNEDTMRTVTVISQRASVELTQILDFSLPKVELLRAFYREAYSRNDVVFVNMVFGLRIFELIGEVARRGGALIDVEIQRRSGGVVDPRHLRLEGFFTGRCVQTDISVEDLQDDEVVLVLRCVVSAGDLISPDGLSAPHSRQTSTSDLLKLSRFRGAGGSEAVEAQSYREFLPGLTTTYKCGLAAAALVDIITFPLTEFVTCHLTVDTQRIYHALVESEVWKAALTIPHSSSNSYMCCKDGSPCCLGTTRTHSAFTASSGSFSSQYHPGVHSFSQPIRPSRYTHTFKPPFSSIPSNTSNNNFSHSSDEQIDRSVNYGESGCTLSLSSATAADNSADAGGAVSYHGALHHRLDALSRQQSLSTKKVLESEFTRHDESATVQRCGGPDRDVRSSGDLPSDLYLQQPELDGRKGATSEMQRSAGPHDSHFLFKTSFPDRNSSSTFLSRYRKHNLMSSNEASLNSIHLEPDSTPANNATTAAATATMSSTPVLPSQSQQFYPAQNSHLHYEKLQGPWTTAPFNSIKGGGGRVGFVEPACYSPYGRGSQIRFYAPPNLPIADIREFDIDPSNPLLLHLSYILKPSAPLYGRLQPLFNRRYLDKRPPQEVKNIDYEDKKNNPSDPSSPHYRRTPAPPPPIQSLPLHDSLSSQQTPAATSTSLAALSLSSLGGHHSSIPHTSTPSLSSRTTSATTPSMSSATAAGLLPLVARHLRLPPPTECTLTSPRKKGSSSQDTAHTIHHCHTNQRVFFDASAASMVNSSPQAISPTRRGPSIPLATSTTTSISAAEEHVTTVPKAFAANDAHAGSKYPMPTAPSAVLVKLVYALETPDLCAQLVATLRHLKGSRRSAHPTQSHRH